uniref:Uncharacterized protein n=1 Tax=Anguilla anguilla TaxID=7936 RepID=A0A0E9XI72_ANGAN
MSTADMSIFITFALILTLLAPFFPCTFEVE